MKNQVKYCPLGEVQRRFGFYLTGAGHETTAPGEPYPHDYHSSDYYFEWEKGRALPEWEYQLLCILSGRGVIEFRRRHPVAIEAGTAIILHPGEWHRYRPDPDTGWSEAYIGFGGECVERMLAKPFFPDPPNIIRSCDDPRFSDELLDLVRRIGAQSAEHPFSLAMSAMAFVARLMETGIEHGGRNAHNTEIRQATFFIAHHLGEVIDFQALAAKSGMSYPLFRKRFREYTGMAPLEYQLALRLRRARHMLMSSDLPITRIASECGFNSPAYFSRFFRSATGMSPVSFRTPSRRPPKTRLSGRAVSMTPPITKSKP